MSRYSAQSFRTWQGVTKSFRDGTKEALTACLNNQGGQRMDVTENETCPLRAESHHPPLVFENHSQDTRYKGPIDVSQTVLSTFGNGGNNQPFVLEVPTAYTLCSKNSNSMQSNNSHSGIYEADASRTLDEMVVILRVIKVV